jgi:choline-sulfatase
MDSAHRMEHKTVLYEESCRVPLLVRTPGAAKRGSVDSHLVSNGLDLVPTVCDYAGAETPDDLRGFSLRPLIEGEGPSGWREWLPVESDMGAMVVTPESKYVLYDDGASREQLVDLAADPGEMRNAAGDPEKARTLERMRDLFAEAYPVWPPAKHH